MSQYTRGRIQEGVTIPVRHLFEILYEDSDLLVVNKPADLVCHPTKGDEYSSLISRARLHLGEGQGPQLVNRLDRETSGVTLIAKTSIAAREVRQLWEDRQVEKEYLAIVHGHLMENEGVIDAPLGKDEGSAVAIKDCVREDGASAQTHYVVESRIGRHVGNELGVLEPFSVVRVRPQTGRKHQIRIHLSHIGHPIVGDKIYGPDEQIYLAFVESRMSEAQWKQLILRNHALHALALRFTWRGVDWEFKANPEGEFCEFLEGGKAA